MILISTTSVEVCGTPERTVTGRSDLGKGGREDFDDGWESLIVMIWTIRAPQVYHRLAMVGNYFSWFTWFEAF